MSVGIASQSVSEGVDDKGELIENSGFEGENGGAEGFGQLLQRCDTTNHTRISRYLLYEAFDLYRLHAT